jgi:hypothetical protein
VTNTVLYGYLIGWAVTSMGLALTRRQQSRPTSVVVVVGAAWPLLLLGVAQFLAVALIAEAARVREPGARSVDDELEDLLTEWAAANAGAHERRLSVATGGRNAR